MSYHRLDTKVGDTVYQKFGGKCQECGSIQDVCVHHKERREVGSFNYNEESNLTLLCRSCHMKHHRNNGDIKTTGNPHGNPFGRRGTPEIILCSKAGCGRPQHAKGLCKKHYTRVNRVKWTHG